MKNKKIALGVTAALFLGSTVGFAAGAGFFDNATTVEQNIYKLANIATQNKQKVADVQSKLDQTTGQQKNLQDQLDSLKQQLANKQNEVNAKQSEIEAKQREVESKQQEVTQKQQEADKLRNELSNAQNDSAQKDARMAELANLSQQKVNELGQ